MNSTFDYADLSSRLRSWFTRRDVLLLAAVVAVAVLVRIAWVAYVNVDPNDGRGDDSVHYHNMAWRLAQGDGYVNWKFGFPTAHWPPAFPASLAVLYKLFGFHVSLAKALNITLAAATVALAYIAAQRCFDRRVAVTGALVLAFFPGQIYFSTLVMAETMFAFAFMLVLVLTLVWTVQQTDARWWQVAAIGMTIGAAAMVRAEGAALVFVVTAIWALTVRPWRRVARYAGLLAIGTALALTPWTVRNAVQLDQFVPLRTNATSVLAQGLDPDVGEAAIRTEQVTSTVGAGLKHQLTRPWETPPLIARRIKRVYENDSEGIFWIQHRTNPPYPVTEGGAGLWRGLANRYFFAAGAAAVFGAAVYLARRDRLALALILPAIGWTLLFGLIPPITRFHFALGPVIAIMAAAFLVFVWDALRGSSVRTSRAADPAT